MLKTIILAGGNGSRMKSEIPKVLHKVSDEYLISHVIKTSEKINSDEIIAVVGYKSQEVINAINNEHKKVKTCLQESQLGTGHAVIKAIEYIQDEDNILVLCGDTPLLNYKQLSQLILTHTTNNNAVTAISIVIDDPTGYGRIIRSNNEFEKIVEQKDATSKELQINEVNAGVYIFKGEALKNALNNLQTTNAQNEYYLTDTLSIIKNNNEKVEVIKSNNAYEFLGINTKVQLEEANSIMRKKTNIDLMNDGVIIKDINSAYISSKAKIGVDTIIEPNVTINGNTIIGDNCTVGANTIITDCIIGNEVNILNSVLTSSKVDDKTTIGPFAYIRPNCNIGKSVKIGDFVEVKNAVIGNKTKISHLTYVGDADLGENINLGCGTITVNYDGKKKARTIIEDNVFVGCNSNLIAPVELKKNSFIAAGTTVTSEVPEKALAIGRVKQQNKENWIKN